MAKARRKTPWAMLLPAFLYMALLWVYPLAMTFWLSLTDASLSRVDSGFVGLQNFSRLIRDPLALKTLFNTLVLAGGSAILHVGIGLAIALALAQRLRGHGLVRIGLLVPWIMSEMAVALIWRWTLNEQFGLFNSWLAALGLSGLPWLSTSSMAMTSIFLAYLWRGIAFSVMLQWAGLMGIPGSLMDAARIDGAGGLRRLVFIVLPHQRYVIAVNGVLVFMQAASMFTLIFALTGGGPMHGTEVITTYAYRIAFRDLNLGYSSTIGVAMFAMFGAFLFLYLRMTLRIRRGERP